MKKVYFAGSITGGRRDIEVYTKIVQKLGEHFKVLSEFVASGDKEVLSDSEIYERDVALIRECDFLFGEVSVISHGVGYEIGYAECHNKPIFLVANKTLAPRVSAMLVGNKNINFLHYSDISEVFELIDRLGKGEV